MRLTAIIAALALSGCATATPGSESVMLSTAADVEGCERLGEAQGDQNLIGGVLQGEARADALRRMRNAAYGMGATNLVMLDMSTGFGGANTNGIAYRCPS